MHPRHHIVDSVPNFHQSQHLQLHVQPRGQLHTDYRGISLPTNTGQVVNNNRDTVTVVNHMYNISKGLELDGPGGAERGQTYAEVESTKSNGMKQIRNLSVEHLGEDWVQALKKKVRSCEV